MELLHSLRLYDFDLEVIRAAIVRLKQTAMVDDPPIKFGGQFDGKAEGGRRVVLSESQLIQIANGLVLIEPESLVAEGSAAWVNVVNMFERHLGRRFTQY